MLLPSQSPQVGSRSLLPSCCVSHAQPLGPLFPASLASSHGPLPRLPSAAAHTSIPQGPAPGPSTARSGVQPCPGSGTHCILWTAGPRPGLAPCRCLCRATLPCPLCRAGSSPGGQVCQLRVCSMSVSPSLLGTHSVSVGPCRQSFPQPQGAPPWGHLERWPLELPWVHSCSSCA